MLALVLLGEISNVGVGAGIDHRLLNRLLRLRR